MDTVPEQNAEIMEKMISEFVKLSGLFQFVAGKFGVMAKAACVVGLRLLDLDGLFGAS